MERFNGAVIQTHVLPPTKTLPRRIVAKVVCGLSAEVLFPSTNEDGSPAHYSVTAIAAVEKIVDAYNLGQHKDIKYKAQYAGDGFYLLFNPILT